MRRRAAAALDERTTSAALQAVSLLLGYPDAELVDRTEALQRVADALPEEPGAPLRRLVAHVRDTDLQQLQQHYTDVFDLRRRCCPYLTWFTHGDTRQRGMALLRFTWAYRSAGAEFLGGELPDHLAVVCEFAATTDLPLGLRLLREHRAGIELLRAALADAGSPYVDAVDAVRGVLGAATAHDVEKALELARTGPPEEEVGLEPYGPPELMGGRR